MTPTPVRRAPQMWKVMEYSLLSSITLLASYATLTTLYFLREVNYNEGWNIYNAIAYRDHALYPPMLTWVSNNYPMLSFVGMGELARLTHDYLYTARIVSFVSLLALSVIVARICRLLHCTRHSSWVAAFFCYTLFSLDTTGSYASALYVGADDPTMLALALVSSGLLLYLRFRESDRFFVPLVWVAAVFVLGLSVKHTLIDIPAVVFVDQLLRKPKRGFWLALCLLFLGALSVLWQVHSGGPGFLTQLTAPRTFSKGRALDTFINVFGPMLVPSLIACITAVLVFTSRERMIASFLFLLGLVLGLYTGSAEGVTFNCFFTALLGLCILCGIFVSQVEQSHWLPRVALPGRWPTALLFAWFVIPLILFDTWNPVRLYRRGKEEESSFSREVSVLRSSKGPALCESLLRCYVSGKPYLYDPFNATRLIHLGLLSDDKLISDIRLHRYQSIELSDPVEIELGYRSEHFTHEVLQAIAANYSLIYHHGRESIYKPRDDSAK